jgi:branched-chain amino acid transport system ATP-binding protein
VLNANEGITFLLVEHDVSFVKDLCERVIVLNQGRKLAEGTPAEIMTNRAVIEAYFGDDGTDPGRAPIAVPESESAGTR